MRINFVHIYGASDTKNARTINQQMADASPVFDEMDIARSGLRPYMTTIPCWVDETREGSGPKKWMELTSDYLMGQHMTLTGVITTHGIQSPICIGDNVQWDNNIYHIEAISHNCSIMASGQKDFSTTLHLSNGMGIDRVDSLGETDMGLYARSNSDLEESTHMPKVSSESELSSTQSDELDTLSGDVVDVISKGVA
jgi:hypothetical protein